MSILGKAAGDLGEECIDVFVAGDVALEGATDAPFWPRSLEQLLFGLTLQTLGVIGEHEGGAGFGHLLGYAVGNAAFIREAKD